MASMPTGKCSCCGYRKRLNKDGTVYNHKFRSAAFAEVDAGMCLGGGQEPVEGTVRTPENYDNGDILPVGPTVTVADVDYAAGWYDRLYWPMIVTALVVAGAALGFAIGVGVEGGWRW